MGLNVIERLSIESTEEYLRTFYTKEVDSTLFGELSASSIYFARGNNQTVHRAKNELRKKGKNQTNVAVQN